MTGKSLRIDRLDLLTHLLSNLFMRHFSKAHYLQFLQCPKLAWTAFNHPTTLTPPDIASEYRMKEGQKVEEYARKLFPGASVIAHEQPFEEVVAQSNAATLRPSEFAICNAILSAGDLITETDILVPIEM